jgi:hypothetical protein
VVVVESRPVEQTAVFTSPFRKLRGRPPTRIPVRNLYTCFGQVVRR